MHKPAETFLVAANGEIDCLFLKTLDFASIDRVVAADGGANRLIACGLRPDTTIGDLDSISAEIKENPGKMEILYRPSQKINDLEKALIYCREQGAGRLIVLGVTGKRLDHAINNFSVLAKYDHLFELQIFDRYSQIFLVRERFNYTGNPQQVVSLIPLGKVNGIVTRGLKYPLKDESLEIGVREGASNAIVRKNFSIRIKSGLLLIFVNRMKADD